MPQNTLNKAAFVLHHISYIYIFPSGPHFSYILYVYTLQGLYSVVRCIYILLWNQLQSCLIILNIDRHLGSRAAKVPVQFQNGMINLTSSPMGTRSGGKTSFCFVNGGPETLDFEPSSISSSVFHACKVKPVIEIHDGVAWDLWHR